MTVASHIALGASSRLFTGGLLLAGAVDAAADAVAIRRAEGAIAQGNLAARLSSARDATDEALLVARDLAAELARTRHALALAQAELVEERAYSASVTAALRQVAAAR